MSLGNKFQFTIARVDFIEFSLDVEMIASLKIKML